MVLHYFNNQDNETKLQLKKKLREMVCPSTTHLHEPIEVKHRTRGRPKKKIDTSTRRDPSGFEYALSGQDSYSPTPTGRRAKNLKPKSFIDSFPNGLMAFIGETKDVVADGNCGFRVIAEFAGLGQNKWSEPGHPVPPIATKWQHRLSVANGWKDAYTQRIQHFKQVVGSDVATAEMVDTIDID
ncbi:hypothetical protein L1049_023848 [Liquidambar formosana]|uniref:OTU domain-containing protein n=1 Tax=Liquidambar formosana TaxID=63359 RepID=A0AAP0RZQ7_LIQFO